MWKRHSCYGSGVFQSGSPFFHDHVPAVLAVGYVPVLKHNLKVLLWPSATSNPNALHVVEWENTKRK